MNKKIFNIVFKLLFAFSVLYGCFIIVKYTHWFTMGEWNRNFTVVSTMIVQVIIQAALSICAVLAIKQKNVLSACISVVPIVFLCLGYFAPSGRFSITSLKKFIEQYSNISIDVIYSIIDVIMVSIILLLTFGTTGICAYRITKNKKSSQPPS